MNDRKAEMKKRGFNMVTSKAQSPGQNVSTDFSKIKVGVKNLTDATFQLGTIRQANPRYSDKVQILRSIERGDLDFLRSVSENFFRSSGIYSRLCKYMARLYRYDWFVTPYYNNCVDLVKNPQQIFKEQTPKQTRKKRRLFGNLMNVLNLFEDFGVREFFGEVALKVMKYGAYYGYILGDSDSIAVQELPVKYCRSRFKVNNQPVVQFNMKYFADLYRDEEDREKIVKLFPLDFQKGYRKYKNGTLQPMFAGDTKEWYMLDPQATFKFNINDQDFPPFISVVPTLIDLDQAKDLDRKKTLQKLLKIIIQKMPIDKNGDLVFDVDQAAQLHNNAVYMLSKAIGVDVLTTFAEIEVADMTDRGTTTSNDQLIKVERSVYNQAGVSQLLFNSDGNIALSSSILNDQSNMYDLVLQFEDFLNKVLKPFNTNPKKQRYRAQILPTTQSNYKQMAKLYREQAQMGYSKMLPAIALGQTQSSILANAYFENDILDLIKVFVPPMSSNVMNADALAGLTGKKNVDQTQEGKKEQKEAPVGQAQVGRPQKPDSEKSDKTIANQQSM